MDNLEWEGKETKKSFIDHNSKAKARRPHAVSAQSQRKIMTLSADACISECSCQCDCDLMWLGLISERFPQQLLMYPTDQWIHSLMH